MLSTYGIWEYIAAIFALTIVSVVLYLKWIYGHWKRRNIDYITPSVPFGNLENPLFIKKGFIGTVNDAYFELKSRGRRYGGIYLINKPIFLPIDPDLVKLILTRDFQHFMNHGSLLDEESQPLTANLFSLEDEKWKNLRNKLTPTFTSGKMKMMFPVVSACCDQMIDHVKLSINDEKSVNVKELASCYTIDVIGSCVFGLDCNSFENPDAEFHKYSRKATSTTILNALGTFIGLIMPELQKVLKVRLVRRDVEDFFTKAFTEVINNRSATNSPRNDFVQLLLEMSASHVGADPKKSLTLNEMIAQAFVFFVAGFDTSSSNIAFCLYHLAKYPDIQDKLRIEIDEVLQKHDGQLTYEAIMEMKYMDQVIDETLRFFPPLPVLNRKCNKDYIIPGTGVKIEKGTSLFITALALHMDEEYYPDPKKFDPDRFSKENKEKRHPYVHIPFGDGPRICIGQRFAFMQIKIGLSKILGNFRVSPNEKTPKYITYEPIRATINCPDDLVLNFENV